MEVILEVYGAHDVWLIWFINQRALYNHALSIICIGVGIIIYAHLPLAQG